MRDFGIVCVTHKRRVSMKKYIYSHANIQRIIFDFLKQLKEHHYWQFQNNCFNNVLTNGREPELVFKISTSVCLWNDSAIIKRNWHTGDHFNITATSIFKKLPISLFPVREKNPLIYNMYNISHLYLSWSGPLHDSCIIVFIMIKVCRRSLCILLIIL